MDTSKKHGLSKLEFHIAVDLRHGHTYRVWIDRKDSAPLPTDYATHTIDVQPGRHLIKVRGRQGFSESHELDVEVLDDDTVPIALELSDVGRNQASLLSMMMAPTLAIRRLDNDPGKRTL